MLYVEGVELKNVDDFNYEEENLNFRRKKCKISFKIV